MMQAPREYKKKKIRFFVMLVVLLIPTLFTSFSVVKSYFESNDGIDELVEKKDKPDKTRYDEPREFQKLKETEVEGEETEDKKPLVKEDSVEQDVVKAPPSSKVVYLTFDDGPSQLTNDFLDVLNDAGIKATFFMQGVNLQNKELQDSVKRASTEGHYVGAHSMTHNFDKLYKEGQFVAEMQETIQLIHDITGTSPNLVRAPYGSAPGLNSEQKRTEVVNANLKLWDWTIDSRDWASAHYPTQIITNIQNETLRDREVVLLHEKKQTLAMLPEIIQFYKEQGYEFVVYDENDHFSLNFQNDERL